MVERAAGSSFLDRWLAERSESLSEQPDHRDLDLSAMLPADTSLIAVRNHLSKYVKGQRESLTDIALLVSMHLAWCKSPDFNATPPSALLIGPTGTGKTFTFRVASEWLKLPFVTVDSTSLVPSGIVGMQVEDIAETLVGFADEILKESGRPRFPDDDIRLAERGIVILDEFDKLKHHEVVGQRAPVSDPMKLSVQRRVLKILEGAPLNVGVRSHASGDRRPVRTLDTRGLLIIASGAFEGLEKAKQLRPHKVSRQAGERSKTLSVDINNFGFIPELVARMPVMINYSELTSDDLLAILRDDAVSPIQVWRNYLNSIGVKLEIDSDVLEAFAEKASALKLGARGLQQVAFPVMSKAIADFFENAGSAGQDQRIRIASNGAWGRV